MWNERDGELDVGGMNREEREKREDIAER